MLADIIARIRDALVARGFRHVEIRAERVEGPERIDGDDERSRWIATVEAQRADGAAFSDYARGSTSERAAMNLWLLAMTMGTQ